MGRLRGYVDEVLAFAGETQWMRIGVDELVARMVFALLRAPLTSGFAFGIAARADFVSTGVRGLLDRLFSPLNLRGEGGVVGGLRRGGGLFGSLNQARVLLGSHEGTL